MKSSQRPFKPPKPQEPKSSAPPLKSDLTPVNNEELNFRQEADHDLISNEPPEPPKVESQVTGKRNKKKIDSPPVTKPHIPFQDRPEEPELPPSPCQHMQFLDCNLEIGRVIFECYHCKQGIISEYTGDPVMGECKGRPKSDFYKGKMPQL
ncbi:hypothetical protein [Nostoc sp. ChiQUE01b]|uniref:hypothetical protein n=1 Tax=Nostoc sp. ChiQUE01b TaxID=3075376 RepID=UPI002AD2844A|nr:hypothetical protein [Nostoc sp. ChiQUE01b]MDZ8264388.1 hypothetical protein [Nostoc sp. ChiQUE01b]